MAICYGILTKNIGNIKLASDFVNAGLAVVSFVSIDLFFVIFSSILQCCSYCVTSGYSTIVF